MQMHEGYTADEPPARASRLPPEQAWRCDVCQYHMLAMDHCGRPLPLERGANGVLLPVMCPRCDAAHTNWSQTTLFDNFGDHANVPASFSTLITKGRPIERAAAQHLVDAHAPQISALTEAERERSGASAAPPQRTAQEAYHCGKCGRRLLRVDSAGRLVELGRDPAGDIVALDCPGCHERHTDWHILPVHGTHTAARPTAPPMPDAPSTAPLTSEEAAILSRPLRRSIV